MCVEWDIGRLVLLCSIVVLAPWLVGGIAWFLFVDFGDFTWVNYLTTEIGLFLTSNKGVSDPIITRYCFARFDCCDDNGGYYSP